MISWRLNVSIKDRQQVARLEATRMFLAFAVHHNFKLYQMDIKSAFLTCPLSKLVYVEQPPGF